MYGFGLVCLQPIPSRSYYYCEESFTLSIWSVGKGESWSLDSIVSDKQLQRWADLVNPFSPCVLRYCGSQNINAMFKSILHLVIRPRYMRIKGPQFLFIIFLYTLVHNHIARCQKKGTGSDDHTSSMAAKPNTIDILLELDQQK